MFSRPPPFVRQAADAADAAAATAAAAASVLAAGREAVAQAQ